MSLLPVPAGVKKELIEHRSPKGKIFEMQDGRLRARSAVGRIHYESTKGAKDWQDVELSLSLKNGVYLGEKAPYKLHIAQDTVGWDLYDREGGWVTVRLAAINDVPIKNLSLSITPQLNGSLLTWPDVVPGLDFEAELTHKGANLNKIVKTKKAPHKWTWDITESDVHIFKIPSQRLAHDNHLKLPLTGDRALTDKMPRRLAEVTIEQSLPVENPDKSVFYTITETVTGRTMRRRVHKVKDWTNDSVMYPVWVDVQFELDADADDGRTKNPAAWFFDTGDSDYGSWSGVFNGGTSNSYTCWRFPNVAIPNGASVTSAAITINTGTLGNAVTVNIHVDDSDRDAPAWGADSNTKEDFTNTGTSANVHLSTTSAQVVIAITSPVASVVEKGTWTSGWALRLGVTSVDETAGTQYMYIHGNENNSAAAALLDVDFDPPSPGGQTTPILAYHQFMRHVMHGGR